MKLQNKEQMRSWEVEIGRGEFGTITLSVTDVGRSEATVALSQVDALSLARVIEEQVKENRKK